MQKFSNMSLSEVASAAAPATMPAAGRVAVPTADAREPVRPNALNTPALRHSETYSDRVERVA